MVDIRETTRPGRERYHHGDLRAALMQAAEELIEEVGPDRMSLRETARRAGVTHAAPAHHFGDLAGLLTELAADGFTRLTADLAAAKRSAPDGRQALIAAGRAYVNFALAHQGLFQLMFRTRSLDQNSPRLEDAANASFSTLARMAPPCPEGTDDTTDRTGRLVRAWSLVHGFAVLAIDGRLDDVLRNAGTDLPGLLDVVLSSDP